MPALPPKVAIVTGASRGIGLAICRSYAALGLHVAMVARSQPELEREAAAIRADAAPRSVSAHVVDVSNEAAVRAMVDGVVREYGRVDLLVNNAGVIGPIGPLETIETAEWMQAIAINLHGTFFGLKAAVPHMRRQGSGRIINFSGGGALLPAPFFDAYSVTKASVVRLTENLALELEGTGVTVCAVAPGGVNTRMFDEMLAAGEAKYGEKMWESLRRRQEAGGDAMEDVTNLLNFLATTEQPQLLNGRVISAKWDAWRSFAEHAGDFDSDIFLMRRIMPKDRGLSW